MTIRICSECHKQMGEVQDGRAEVSPSHGICPDCMRANHNAAYLWSREQDAMRRGAASARGITVLLESPIRRLS